jgi:aspartyl-tRNA(Asn)/glutamyl-tRNA(Gln) amidotransferase subunit C
MKITDEIVDHIAHLARLEFEGEAKEHIKADLINVLDFVDQLNAVDTDGAEPLIFMTESNNVLREDIVVESITQSEALKNAPNHDSDYFKIAKVLKQQ